MLVETRCGRLFVDERGEGPPLVLWHSLFCDGGMWRGQLDALAEGHRVLNVDAPGHGRSAPTTRPYSLEDCVDALFDVMDAAGLSSASVIGLSWGGMVGLRAALRDPTRVERLVLLDTNADAESPEKLRRYRVLAFFARRLGAVPALVDRVVPIFFSPKTLATRPDLVRSFREHLEGMDRASLSHAFEAVELHRGDIRSQLSRIRCPTLVLCGVDDRATPVARSEEIAQRIAGSERALVPDAGHLSALERPDVVTPLLVDWLARTAGSRDRA